MIDHEVEEINKILERVLCGSKIITCIRSLVKCKDVFVMIFYNEIVNEMIVI